MQCRIRVLSLFLFSTFACGESEQLDESGQISALTYNVAGLPTGISGSNPEDNAPIISPLLNQYDLVLLQEDFFYHEKLTRDTLHPFQSIPKPASNGYVSDGLNQLSQYSWTDFQRVQWIACHGDANEGAADCLSEKGFTLSRMSIGKNSIVDVYNLHVEAGNGPKDQQARSEGIQQFIEFVQQNSQQNPVIIGGDFNLHARDPEDLALIEKIQTELSIQDACLALDCGIDIIDRFYFRSNEEIELVPSIWRIGDEFIDQTGDDLSDHNAINVNFEWSTR